MSWWEEASPRTDRGKGVTLSSVSTNKISGRMRIHGGTFDHSYTDPDVIRGESIQSHLWWIAKLLTFTRFWDFDKFDQEGVLWLDILVAKKVGNYIIWRLEI